MYLIQTDMSAINEFWNNRTAEDKRKLIAYVSVGLIGVLMLFGIYKFNNRNTNETVADFENPDAKEVKKFNNRTEASIMSKDTVTANASLDNIFGSSSSNRDITTSENTVTTATYQAEPSYTPVSSSNRTTVSKSAPPVNSHNTYGDYSMWQTNEPNNSIGYTDVAKPTKTVKKNKVAPVVATTKDYVEEDFYNPPTPTQTVKPKDLTKEEKLQNAIANKYSSGSVGNNSNQVLAEIYTAQKISGNNASVRIILKDKLYFNNTIIGTDAFVYGFASFNQNSITITVPNISYKGKNYPVNLVAYDYRTGELGIPVSSDNIVGVAGKKAEQQVQQEMSRYGGTIGGVLSSILSGRNKTVSIQLNDGHRMYLKTK